nr:glutamic acid-rich protein-like isoform X1 [Ipomoea batatas]
MVVEDVKQEQKKGIDESQIEAALRSRLEHLKENANSFTLERVRRLIEKDLDIEKYAIDIHKRFIKQFLEEVILLGLIFHPYYIRKLKSLDWTHT